MIQVATKDSGFLDDVVTSLAKRELHPSLRYRVDPSNWDRICEDPSYSFFQQEMANLEHNQDDLKQIIGDRVLVVYGAGGFQKEAMTAKWIKENAGHVEVHAFDACADYERAALDQLRKQVGDNFDLSYYTMPFEKAESVVSSINVKSGRCFVCYGGTAGNYDNEVFRIFAENMTNPNDIMIYGFMVRNGSSEEDIQELYASYNPRLPWMIAPLTAVRGQMRGVDRLLTEGEITYEFDRASNFLVMRLVLGDSAAPLHMGHNGDSVTYQAGDSLILYKTRRPTLSSLVERTQEAGHGKPKLIATHPEHTHVVNMIV